VEPKRNNVLRWWGEPRSRFTTSILFPVLPSREDEQHTGTAAHATPRAIIASMIFAGARIAGSTDSGNFALLFVVGEERTARGACRGENIREAPRSY